MHVTLSVLQARVLAWEKQDGDAFFVFLSEIWLDKADVLEKLRRLLAGYSAAPPVAFVFMGNFCSAPYGEHHIRVLTGTGLPHLALNRLTFGFETEA